MSQVTLTSGVSVSAVIFNLWLNDVTTVECCEVYAAKLQALNNAHVTAYWYHKYEEYTGYCWNTEGLSKEDWACIIEEVIPF